MSEFLIEKRNDIDTFLNAEKVGFCLSTSHDNITLKTDSETEISEIILPNDFRNIFHKYDKIWKDDKTDIVFILYEGKNYTMTSEFLHDLRAIF